MQITIRAGIAVAAIALLVPAAASAEGQPQPRPGGGNGRDGVNFVSACRFSQTAPDDPIVKPGQPGASHEHTFFANTTTDANSTYESLRAGGTTCRRSGDTAAYWVPTLFEGGSPQRASHVLAYYVPAGKDPTSIRPFPAGLKVVTDSSLPNTRWGCVGRDQRSPDSRQVPKCPEGQHLVLRVLFPDCWDGRNIDSADHRSHLAYNRRGTCPADHPVPLPRLRLNVHYPGSNGGSDVALSSGAPATAHADFFNAWDQRVLADLVVRCINAEVHCGQRGPA